MIEEAFPAPDLLCRSADRPRQREPVQRPSSQPAPAARRKRKKRSPNCVPQKAAASPHLMSSIIASLDHVAAPTALPATHHHPLPGPVSQHSSTTDAALSRASSRKAPYMPLPPPPPPPKLRRSISLGVDPSAHHSRVRDRPRDYPSDNDTRTYLDEDDDDDAAAFPVVRTSRPPSGRSPHTAFFSPSRTGSLTGYLRSASSRSSLSLVGLDLGKSRLKHSSSRLSLESWLQRPLFPSQISVDSKTDPPKQIMAAQQPSNDTLTAKTPREEDHTAALDDYPSTPVQPIREATDAPAQTPALPQSPTVPSAILKWGSYTDIKQDKKKLQTGDLLQPGREELPQRTKAAGSSSPDKPASPTKQPIADAIPLRVSSLNRTTPPRHQKTKSSRMDRSRRAPSSTRKHSATRAPPEPARNATINMFDGLDEQDTTVKRIRELKQKKEERLQREYATAERSSKNEKARLPDPAVGRTDAETAATSRSDRPKSISQTVTRTSLLEADVRKAHKVLGLDGPSNSAGQGQPLPALSDREALGPNIGAGPELITRLPLHPSRRRLSEPRDTKPAAATRWSSRQPVNHSNAHADYALASLSPAPDDNVKRRTATKQRLLNGLDVVPPPPADLTPPSTSHSLNSRRSRSRSNSTNLDRWSYSDTSARADERHPKERRKSMSDARNDRGLEEEILQERRNSVLVSVDEYLGAPRLNQKIRSPQSGRLISFSEVGDPAGAAVIVCVGMGLTRYVTAFYDELAATLGLRLITLDRPGVGESEPYPERERVGPLSWPDDVLAVTQHLRITEFSILAHSAGAIYALATALILPHCIRGKVQLLAPWIPPSQFDTFGIKDLSPDATPVGALPRSQRLLRVLPIPFFKAANGGLFSPSSLKPSSVRSSPSVSPNAVRDSVRGKPKRRTEPLKRESMLLLDQVVPEKPVNTMFPLPELAEMDGGSGLQPVRRPSVHLTATATPTDPEWMYVAEALDAAEHSARERQTAYSSLLTEQTWNLATRNSNPATDLLVCLERHRDIGFRYVDITRQIVMTHGSEDKRVPVENVKWMGEQINRRAASNWSPDAKQEFRERGGCEVRVLPGEGHGLMASPGVMADVLAEIGRERTATKW